MKKLNGDHLVVTQVQGEKLSCAKLVYRIEL